MVRFIYNHSKKNLTLGRPEMTQHDCEEILIHEMVHAWQNYMGISYWRDGHRGCFIRKANEINQKSRFSGALQWSLERVLHLDISGF